MKTNKVRMSDIEISYEPEKGDIVYKGNHEYTIKRLYGDLIVIVKNEEEVIDITKMKWNEDKKIWEVK